MMPERSGPRWRHAGGAFVHPGAREGTKSSAIACSGTLGADFSRNARVESRVSTMMQRTLFIALATLAVAVPASAQVRERASLKGKLVDTESLLPIISASIALLGDQDERLVVTMSDDEGGFGLTVPGGGSYRFLIEHLGYPSTIGGPVVLVGGTTTEVELRVSPTPLLLDSINVMTDIRSMRLTKAGFYRRRVQGVGLFIDRNEIDQRSPSETTDLLTGLAGVTYRYDQFGRKQVILRGGIRPQGACFPAVYVDGLRMSRMLYARSGPQELDVAPAQIDDMIAPIALEGLEVYRSASEVPAMYGGPDAACGVIVIWSR